MTTPDIFFDSALVALSSTPSLEEQRAFLVAVEEWAVFFALCRPEYSTSSEALGELAEQELYPTIEKIRSAVFRTSESCLSAGDVARWISKLLEGGQVFETRYDCLFEGIKLSPTTAFRCARMQLASEKVLARAGWLGTHGRPVPLACAVPASTVVTVEAQVLRDAGGTLVQENLLEVVPLISKTADYWKQAIPELFWATDPRRAIEIETMKQWLAGGGRAEQPPEVLTKLRIGSGLLLQAALCGITSNDGYLRSFLVTCGEALLSLNLTQVHPLRTGGGGDDRQRRRTDGALAWRRDVTRGYHLHYWKSDGYLELSWVGHHDDYECP